MSDLLEVAQAIQGTYQAELHEYAGETTLTLSKEHIIPALRLLRDHYQFDMLADETAVDYWPQEQPRFHVVYQLVSTKTNQLLRLRVPVDAAEPQLPTAETVFPSANWHEREIWDMFGIRFDGHSDLRRLIMPYDWVGHPLRKDYPLGYEEVQFTFNEKEIMVHKPHPSKQDMAGE